MSGIELAGVAPDLQIGLLHDVGREVMAAQDAQHHAIEVGAGRPVQTLERNRVAKIAATPLYGLESDCRGP